MKLKYLGTGASEGWPAVFCQCEACRNARKLGGKNIRRRHSALLDGRLLFDMPPDVFAASLATGTDLSAVRDFVITHAHEDHFYAHELINFAEPFAHIPESVTNRLYGSCTVLGVAREAISEWNTAGRLALVEAEPLVPFEAAGFIVTPLPASHGAGVSLIYLVQGHGKTMLYAHDTGWPKQEVWNFLKGVRLDYVSMDCTSLDGERYDSHMTIDENIAMKEKLLAQGSAGSSTVFVSSHFSHNGILLHEQAEQRLAPHGILTAYDGFEAEF